MAQRAVRAGRRGGSLGLAELIDSHGEAIEADLQAHYGLDLNDVYRDPDDPRWLSPARVHRLLHWVPDDGAFAASVQGGRAHLGWGFDRHLDTSKYELDAAVAMAGSKKKPPTIDRPKQAGTRRRRREGAPEGG